MQKINDKQNKYIKNFLYDNIYKDLNFFRLKISILYIDFDFKMWNMYFFL